MKLKELKLKEPEEPEELKCLCGKKACLLSSGNPRKHPQTKEPWCSTCKYNYETNQRLLRKNKMCACGGTPLYRKGNGKEYLDLHPLTKEPYCIECKEAHKIVAKEISIQRNKELTDFYKATNFPILSMIMYGDVRSDREFICCGSHRKIRESSAWDNKLQGNFYLHHILVKDGKSVVKKELEPSQLLSSKLKEEGVKELMQCVLFSDPTHKKLHTMYRDMDITVYKQKQKPYLLQSKSKFNKVKKYLNSLSQFENVDFGDFEALIKSVTFN